jgi:anti-sigma regulatory factor (Ser/Thr protein kinase)
MPGLRWQRVFRGEPQQVAAVRRWITSLLPDCPSRADLVLVASELAGNSVRHSASGQGGTFAVQITWGGDTVAVAVDDAGGPSKPRIVDDPLSEGGRGLLIVRELSVRMSVSGTDAGRQMRAEILWHDPAEAATGQAYLGSRFGVPAWYSSCTRLWWGLAGGQLLSAPSVPERRAATQPPCGCPPTPATPTATTSGSRRSPAPGPAGLPPSTRLSSGSTQAAWSTWPSSVSSPAARATGPAAHSLRAQHAKLDASRTSAYIEAGRPRARQLAAGRVCYIFVVGSVPRCDFW